MIKELPPQYSTWLQFYDEVKDTIHSRKEGIHLTITTMQHNRDHSHSYSEFKAYEIMANALEEIDKLRAIGDDLPSLLRNIRIIDPHSRLLR